MNTIRMVFYTVLPAGRTGIIFFRLIFYAESCENPGGTSGTFGKRAEENR
jgi:hypothetical protein